MDHVKIDLKK